MMIKRIEPKDYANEKDICVLAAAITTIPYNEESMAFHAKMGFAEVGEQLIRSDTVKVSKLTRGIAQ